MKEADIVIRNANELVTMKDEKKGPRIKKEMSDLQVLNDGWIALKDGKIISIGVGGEEIPSAEKVIDASGKTVLPGFVDPHTHLIFAGSREFELEMKLKGATYLEILESGGGILNTVKRTRNASKEGLVEEAKKRLDIMLKFGTTTAEAKSGYGLDTATEIKSLEAIEELNKEHPVDLIPTFLGAHARPPEYKKDPDAYINLVIDEMLPQVMDKNLAKFCDVFCEKNVFSVEQSRKLLNKAKKFGLAPKIHADEIVPLGGAELAAEIGAVSAEHLMVASDKGLEEMAKAGVCAVLLPGTPYALLEKEYANARKMIEKGVPVAVATDLNPNCWTESMQFIISLSCYQMRMTPAEAITASTINSAYAIRRADEVGSLETGKKADVIILDVPNHKHIPYHFGINLVETVIKNGKVIV